MIGNGSGKFSSLMRKSVFGALLLFLVMSFQNCGSDFMMMPGLDLGSVTESGLKCELNAFKTTYMPFLAKCKGCHVPGGTGAGAFSSTNADVAFTAFNLSTATKIDERAVNTNHAPGITGPANQAAIDSARPQFDNAIATCRASPTPGGTPVPTGAPALTTSKNLSSAATQTLTWNLSSELSGGTAITGATFSIVVQSTTQASGAVLFTITQPRVTTTSQAVRVSQIMLNYNGVDLPLVTTFSRVERTIPINQTNISLSAAAGAYEAPASGAT